MNLYNFHPQTREFLGQSVAKSHPKREGEFLIPSFSTEIPLPDALLAEGHKWQFGDDVWNAVEDHRGETCYSTETGQVVDIQELGPLPVTVTPLAPATSDDTWDGSGWQTPAATIDQLKAIAAEKRWRVEIGGTTWNGWQQATDDRGQAKCAFELQAIDEGLRADGDGWKFAHGFEALTNVQMHAVVMAVRAHVKASYEAEAAILALIDDGAITTLQGVENWAGWAL